MRCVAWHSTIQTETVSSAWTNKARGRSHLMWLWEQVHWDKYIRESKLRRTACTRKQSRSTGTLNVIASFWEHEYSANIGAVLSILQTVATVCLTWFLIILCVVFRCIGCDMCMDVNCKSYTFILAIQIFCYLSSSVCVGKSTETEYIALHCHPIRAFSFTLFYLHM